jgi:hypothetical protein
MADGPDVSDAPDEREAPRKRSAAPRTSSGGDRSASGSAPRRTRTAPQRPRRQAASDEDDGTEDEGNGNDGGESEGGSGTGPALGASDVAVAAAQQLVTLTGKTFEGIVGLGRKDHGWDVEVEVVEMRRIPSTTDVIAVYRVSVDRAGDLISYRRINRYARGQAGEER